MQKFCFSISFYLWMVTEVISMGMFQKRMTGGFCEGLRFPKLSVVEDRLNIIGFLGFMPKTSSDGKRFIVVLICEFNAKGKVFTFFDHLSYFESRTLRENVFNCQFFSANPFDQGAYCVLVLKCTLYIRQKCANSQLMY